MTYRPISIAFPSGFILTYRQPILCHCVREERGASLRDRAFVNGALLHSLRPSGFNPLRSVAA